MKYIIILLTLVSTPLFASHACIDNSKHLTESYDNKEWHAVPSCTCPCDTIKGRRCIQCGHLQNALTYDIINTTKTDTKAANYPALQIPENPQNVLRKLAAQYLQNR